MTDRLITVNCASLPLQPSSPHISTLDWLRERGLTGAKEGCAEGECGACSVLVARPGITTPTEWVSINACLLPAASLEGQEIITAEGLGSSANLHPVQQELAARGGSQCGYCTPGFVCSMAAEFYRSDRETTMRLDEDHGPNGFDLHALSGNLCRCTGYRPIRDAACALGSPAASDDLAARRDRPPPPVVPGRFGGVGAELVRPADLGTAMRVLAENPEAELAAGFTDRGVQMALGGHRPELTICIDRLGELRNVQLGPTHVEIGAALSLTDVGRLLGGQVPLLDQLLPQFASRLIRNSATLGGNLGTGSPVGDAAPALLALDASVVLSSLKGDREVVLADYFTGYRQSVRRADEIIRSIRIPLPLARHTAFHKVAKRRFDDISSVAVAVSLDIDDGVVTVARIGLGGVAATPLRARATEESLVGRPWDRDSVATAAVVLAAEGTPMDDHRASAGYRRAMLHGALLKTYADLVVQELA